MFKKILIANRGEIAVRVIRACHEMGIAAVAVYSEADRAALHVLRADEAYPIGPAPASDSYLSIQRILKAAGQSGAEAIHPGYGFLSENPRFARACREAGIKFIGPPPESMEMMGSKTRARQQMEKAGVPFVPGTSRGLSSLDEANEVAAKLGYPVILKAAAGGGGKGMRLVSSPADLRSGLEAARSEALRAFGDQEVYIEKAIVNPRHIEMQILADEHGNTVYLGERDCSVQRRHQKVVEECPSPVVDDKMRREMGEIAVKAAQAAGYSNAGTIEFLADRQNKFYFLEMNTRLQVEHPVTELVTGLDLVQLQIRIAAGERLPFKQDDVKLRGHAIECRIYAEDPDNNYFPSPGEITALNEPSGPGVRVDSGVYAGWKVPLDYDPLLAKLVGYGETRERAIGKVRRALDEYFVAGVKTNLALFRRILEHPEFVAGQADTGLLGRMQSAVGTQDRAMHDEKEIASLAAAILQAKESMARGTGNSGDSTGNSSEWKKIARAEGVV